MVCVFHGCRQALNAHVETPGAAVHTKALREVRRLPDHQPVIISRKNNVVMSGNGGENDLLSFHISDAIQDLASAIEISPFNLQRVLSYVNRKGSNRVTSGELVIHMGITQRSAARILNKLENGGVVKQVLSQQINLSGRPAKVYEIDLDKINA